jgi:hypothetical protein
MIVLGEMRYKIIVQELVVTKDANNGSMKDTYVTKYTLKAKKVRTSGVNLVQNQEIFNTNTLIFQCHYRNIVETDRILFENNNYKINNISEIGYREGLEITIEKLNE